MIDLEKMIKEKGDDWMIAALVHGSIGYYSPHSTKIHLDRLRNRDFDSNDRIEACFQGDSSRELEHDTRSFASWEAMHPNKASALIEFVKKTKQVTDFAFNAGFSAAAPTSRLSL